ncbi:MAG: zinc metallopeptidase [Oscillospiraceae bacterium]
MPFFYIDNYYLFLVIPTLLITVWAQFKVKSTYSKFSKINNARGYDAQTVARSILDANGLQAVKIVPIQGNLTDHYDPRNNTIGLSQSVYNQTSVAAIGVAAHEVGHAIQYSQCYKPIKIRNALVPITQLGSSIAMPMAIFGLILGFPALTTIGIWLFAAVVLFQLVTLPVEFNASSKALNTLETENFLYGDEITGAKKVLSAAALTYVGALLVSIANLLRLILLSRDRD